MIQEDQEETVKKTFLLILLTMKIPCKILTMMKIWMIDKLRFKELLKKELRAR